MLVLRCICLAPPQTEDDGLRSLIFRTTCTINKKICSLVIDSGSCQKVVSEEAARKLCLKRESHPAPYKFTWLQEEIELRVFQHAHVTLSIGAYYKDTIMCDIVPMEVSHILLGRPWLFDRDVTNNGRENTYSFIFGNRKIVLPDPPLTPASIIKTHVNPTTPSSASKVAFLCSRSEFEVTLQHIGFAFALLPSSVTPRKSHDEPPAFTTLLDEFHDVFPS